MNNEYDTILISNDLDLFYEEMNIVYKHISQTSTHDFQNPNINLNSFHVDLSKYFTQMNESYYGLIYSCIKLAISYDQNKYKNINIIPKVSRKQKSSFEYMKKVRPYFEKWKKNDSKFEIQSKSQFESINTIPEYLDFICSQNSHFYYKQISTYLSNFKLALIYGYPIICGIKHNNKNQVVLIVGFDNKNFKIRYFDTIIEIDHNNVLKNCFNPSIFYSKYFTCKDINLGFLN